jgi:hypothetical protein
VLALIAAVGLAGTVVEEMVLTGVEEQAWTGVGVSVLVVVAELAVTPVEALDEVVGLAARLVGDEAEG